MSDERIARVESFALTVPAVEGQGTAQGQMASISIVLVRIETASGAVGWGEGLARSAPLAYARLIDELLAPILVGADPYATEALWQRMYRVFTGRSGGVLLEALAAVDMALWDMKGHLLDQPLHRLLGTTGRTTVPVYGGAVAWQDDARARQQAEALVGRGFRALKVKLGGPVKAAARRAALVRETVGPDIKLVCDANWIFSTGDAIALARELGDLGYLWLEEPIAPEDMDGYRQLRDASPIRIAAGESEHTSFGAAALIAERAVGVIQPDVARSGGVSETWKIAAIARAFHVAYAPHVGASGALCAAASLHLAAAAPNHLVSECMTYANPLRIALCDFVPGDPADLVDGELPIPTGPGLGVTPRENALKSMDSRC